MNFMKFCSSLTVSLLILPFFAFSQGDSFDKRNIIAEGETLKTISEQFVFTEGPAANQAGEVFFTDQPSNKIWKFDNAGNLSVFMDDAGRSNGLFFDKNDNLISCADEKNELWEISPKGEVKVLLKDFEGKLFNGPNDVWVNPITGIIYFTDPYYKRDYWSHTAPELESEAIYSFKKNDKQATLQNNSLVKPNGIVGTPDGKFLYVADIGDGKTYRFEIAQDGALVNKTLFANMGSDGMTLDQDGNLYITGNGVTVFDKEGEKIAFFPIAGAWVGNICFSGPDRKTLFITASKGVYTLRMNTVGAY